MSLSSAACRAMFFSTSPNGIEVCSSSGWMFARSVASIGFGDLRQPDQPGPHGVSRSCTAGLRRSRRRRRIRSRSARALTPTLAAESDREWALVLDRVKQSQDLAELNDLLAKWRHTAYTEIRDPGSYYRTLGRAEQILRTGQNPDAVPFEDMQALIAQRQGG